jgi:hypothetical protein
MKLAKLPGFIPASPLRFKSADLYAGIGYYHVWAGYNEWASYYASASGRLDWTMRDCALHGGLVNLGLPANAIPSHAGLDCSS